ncbi:MAG: cell division protein CrgA [Nocardioidaceae bacterium]
MSNRNPVASAPDKLSIPRTAIAALLALVGIAWVVVYDVKGIDDKISWMYDLGDWNWLIGFGLVILALLVASARNAPLGRGRGVVIGMLGCFLLGLAWIVLYYFTANSANFPLLSDLGQWNLGVGIGFIATGFIFATKWE